MLLQSVKAKAEKFLQSAKVRSKKQKVNYFTNNMKSIVAIEARRQKKNDKNRKLKRNGKWFSADN